MAKAFTSFIRATVTKVLMCRGERTGEGIYYHAAHNMIGTY